MKSSLSWADWAVVLVVWFIIRVCGYGLLLPVQPYDSPTAVLDRVAPYGLSHTCRPFTKRAGVITSWGSARISCWVSNFDTARMVPFPGSYDVDSIRYLNTGQVPCRSGKLFSCSFFRCTPFVRSFWCYRQRGGYIGVSTFHLDVRPLHELHITYRPLSTSSLPTLYYPVRNVVSEQFHF